MKVTVYLPVILLLKKRKVLWYKRELEVTGPISPEMAVEIYTEEFPTRQNNAVFVHIHNVFVLLSGDQIIELYGI